MSKLLDGIPRRVRVVEVSPRDGLQNEDIVLETEEKLKLVRILAESGLHDIEVSSFVNPKRVPQLADADQLFAALNETEEAHNVRFSALVPNRKGLDRALACGVKAIALFTAASETFTQQNIVCGRHSAVLEGAGGNRVRRQLRRGDRSIGHCSRRRGIKRVRGRRDSLPGHQHDDRLTIRLHDRDLQPTRCAFERHSAEIEVYREQAIGYGDVIGERASERIPKARRGEEAKRNAIVAIGGITVLSKLPLIDEGRGPLPLARGWRDKGCQRDQNEDEIVIHA